MNKNFIKIGILSLAIVIPIFLYLFLVTFGQNTHKIKTFHPVEVIEKVDDNGKKKIDTIFHKVEDFKLLTHLGDSFSTASIPNSIYVLDFFFSRCGGICPKMTKQLLRVQERFKDRKDFKILSLSVDQDFDSPEVLTSYAKRFGANDSLWLFMAGNRSKTFYLAKTQFFLNAMEDNTGEQEEFVHSEKLVLVDKNRNIRGYYNGTLPEEVDRLMVEMDILFFEYSKQK
ncbi:MAG: SCO family protein [Cytophagales bacterium]